MSVAPRTSIVIPCYNEAGRIGASVETLLGWLGEDTEVLVVDDGSTDGSLEAVQQVAAEPARVRVARLPRNQGKGAAIRAAIPLVRGERVILMDADLAYDRHSVLRILNGLEDADVVIGNRRHRDSRYSVPVRLFSFLWRRHLAGLTFNAFVRTLLPISWGDTQCGLKGFRTPALQRMDRFLTTNGFALDLEMLLVARGLNLRIVDAPVMVTYDSEQSSVHLMRSGTAAAGEIVRLAIRRLQGRYSRLG